MEINTLKSLEPIAAQEFIRKMRGGSQSCLVRAEDGNFYILKMLDNPQGSEILLHEALGTELMRHLGLPVPAWSLIKISNTFLDGNPGMWFEVAGSNPQRPRSGLHFGSRLISGSERILYEILPRTWFGRIMNRADFIGAWLFDLWAGQQDRRQAMFVPDRERGGLRAVFIDQGALFSVSEGMTSRGFIRAMFSDTAIYDGLNYENILPFWKDRIRNLNVTQCIDEFHASGLPAEWYNSRILQRLASALIDRQAQLDVCISCIHAALGRGISKEPVVPRTNSRGDVQLYRSE